MGHDVVVVGAGFAGSVIAERLASQTGRSVLVLDKRPHIGGNAYDETDDSGILIHRYGPHIFHTNSADIFSYLSGFTQWRPYEHRVLAAVRDRLVPIPINRTTVNEIFLLSLADDAQCRPSTKDRSSPAVRLGPLRMPSSGRSAASCTSCSSAATRASNGGSIRPSLTHR